MLRFAVFRVTHVFSLLIRPGAEGSVTVKVIWLKKPFFCLSEWYGVAAVQCTGCRGCPWDDRNNLSCFRVGMDEILPGKVEFEHVEHHTCRGMYQNCSRVLFSGRPDENFFIVLHAFV